MQNLPPDDRVPQLLQNFAGVEEFPNGVEERACPRLAAADDEAGHTKEWLLHSLPSLVVYVSLVCLAVSACAVRAHSLSVRCKATVSNNPSLLPFLSVRVGMCFRKREGAKGRPWV